MRSDARSSRPVILVLEPPPPHGRPRGDVHDLSAGVCVRLHRPVARLVTARTGQSSPGRPRRRPRSKIVDDFWHLLRCSLTRPVLTTCYSGRSLHVLPLLLIRCAARDLAAIIRTRLLIFSVRARVTGPASPTSHADDNAFHDPIRSQKDQHSLTQLVPSGPSTILRLW